MPFLSIIVGYRDRDASRVERFIRSLDNQTYRDFELIFVDYGSKNVFSLQVERLCSEYPFCRYVYNHTEGMFWNRSHALNSGIRRAQGEYIVCTDIDMIFAENVLAITLDRIGDHEQWFCPVHLAPESFTEYETIVANPPACKVTKKSGKGGFHLAPKRGFEAIRGFDEFYRIWGVEDRDCAMRLENSGLHTNWFDPAEVKIYHQWHPSSLLSNSYFPKWWWDEMSVHYSFSRNYVKRNNREWGKVLTPEDRKIASAQVFERRKYPGVQNAFRRSDMIEEIIDSARKSKGGVIEVITERDDSGTRESHKKQGIRQRLFRKPGYEMKKSVRPDLVPTFTTLQYLILKLSIQTEILEDYWIESENENEMQVRLKFLENF